MQSYTNNYKSTTRDVKRILNELSMQKVDGVVVDLRDNGGGLLHEAKHPDGPVHKRAAPRYRSARPTAIPRPSMTGIRVFPTRVLSR
jgi:hypothetical protein